MIVIDTTIYEDLIESDRALVQRIVQALRESPVEVDAEMQAIYDGDYAPYSFRVVIRTAKGQKQWNFTWGYFECDDETLARRVDELIIQPLLKH
ncbi:MAG: hypothetical protein IT320_20790 [Anaerolineae bacterium]|nr:hypothetical protein [Anaerolineae bacterium]